MRPQNKSHPTANSAEYQEKIAPKLAEAKDYFSGVSPRLLVALPMRTQVEDIANC